MLAPVALLCLSAAFSNMVFQLALLCAIKTAVLTDSKEKNGRFTPSHHTSFI